MNWISILVPLGTVFANPVTYKYPTRDHVIQTEGVSPCEAVDACKWPTVAAIVKTHQNKVS